VSRGLRAVALLAPALLVSASASHAQHKASKARPATSQQTVKALGSTGGGTAKPSICRHTVRSGESISRIAVRYRVSRAALVHANRLANPHALRSGQQLAVPNCQPPAPATVGESSGPEPAADGVLITRVGPRRILTSLVLAEPDFQGAGIPLIWPVEGPVISAFGQRSRGWHAGIDIKAPIGSEIYAAAPGTVEHSGWIRSYGNVVKIQHSNGFITLYAHNQKNLVEVGAEVEAGQLIATVGRSGEATGPHVHFEVRRDGKAYNPLHLLAPSDQSPILDDEVAAASWENGRYE